MIKQIQAFDTRTFLSLLDTPFHTPLTRLALIVSFTADGWLYFVLLPIILITKDTDVRYWLTLAMLAIASERTIYYVMKNTIRRRRPPAALEGFKASIVASDEFSFPSGHTSGAFLFVTFLSFGISLLFLPLYLWAMSVGASRVILGVHFPTDTIMGAVIGTSIALAYL
ncbi:MAG: phosphatase PAP2 family protein [Pseudomonadota bacterium]